MPPLLLLVEDDETLGVSAQEFFIEFDYQVTWLKHGGTAKKILETHTFDLLIFDLNLPEVTGRVLPVSVRDKEKSNGTLRKSAI